MSAVATAATHLSKAVNVFDHFHVIKLFNDKLAGLRRALYREATEQLHKDIAKPTAIEMPDSSNSRSMRSTTPATNW